MPSRSIIPAWLCLLAALPAFIGCTSDPVYPEKQISVTVANLPQVEGDLCYELWVSYPKQGTKATGTHLDHEDAQYLSVGKFRVDAAGAPVGLDGGAAAFAIPSGYNPNLIMDSWLTVEHADIPHALPSRVVVSGLFTGDEHHAKATLTMADGDAFGEKLNPDSTGWCALTSETSAAPEDSVSGIWFVAFKPSLGIPGAIDTVAGLPLATQPLNTDNASWTYQSWLIRNAGTPQAEYIKMGRFRSVRVPDDNGAGPGAGTRLVHAFYAPGEDFVAGTRRVLNDGTYSIAVSIEPEGIEFSRPFLTILTVEKIPAGAAAFTMLFLDHPKTSPTAEVVVDR